MAAKKQDIFEAKVLPIMDKVMADLRHKQSEEVAKHCNSIGFIMAGAAGPDGGMSSQAASLDSLRYTGKWNSKHTEDYIKMVKDELKKQKIAVTPQIEKKMIDKMIKDEIPKSSIDYIMRKAATNTLFYLPKSISKSPLEHHITEQAEKKYNPSMLEKGAGWALGTATDIASTGGFGMGWKVAGKIAATEVGLGAAAEVGIPMVIDPDQRDEYLRDMEKQAQKDARKQKKQEKPKPDQKEVEEKTDAGEKKEDNTVKQETPQQKTNDMGWGSLINTLGLGGFGDILTHPGTTIAMLPDILVGLFTGKTKSLNMKDSLMPLACIVGSMFVRNPLLKTALMGIGGANLLNKAGHEILENKKREYGIGEDGVGQETSTNPGKDPQHSVNHYRQYADEPLNPRITDPQLSGNFLVMTIDKIPCTTSLPPNIIEAYTQGALPLNTLANAILSKSEQMQHIASENYEASQPETIQRGRTIQ